VRDTLHCRLGGKKKKGAGELLSTQGRGEKASVSDLHNESLSLEKSNPRHFHGEKEEGVTIWRGRRALEMKEDDPAEKGKIELYRQEKGGKKGESVTFRLVVRNRHTQAGRRGGD